MNLIHKMGAKGMGVNPKRMQCVLIDTKFRNRQNKTIHSREAHTCSKTIKKEKQQTLEILATPWRRGGWDWEGINCDL
jgi:hypothetical protein